MTTRPDWDVPYTAPEPPAWDIGRPQAAFVKLAESGLLSGLVLDAGCGTGEHSLLAAAHGADVTGVDVSPHAIGRARQKAADRRQAVRFEIGDALALADLGLSPAWRPWSGPVGRATCCASATWCPVTTARAGSPATTCAVRSATAGTSPGSRRRAT